MLIRRSVSQSLGPNGRRNWSRKTAGINANVAAMLTVGLYVCTVISIQNTGDKYNHKFRIYPQKDYTISQSFWTGCCSIFVGILQTLHIKYTGCGKNSPLTSFLSFINNHFEFQSEIVPTYIVMLCVHNNLISIGYLRCFNVISNNITG